MPEDPDSELVSRLRAGDEGAFAELAGKYQGAMMSMARGYVPSGAVAEEVVQDAWVGVLSGYRPVRAPFIVRTWLFRILVNRAISAGVRERRERPRGRYGARRHASRFDASGGWQVPPEPWADRVDDKRLSLSPTTSKAPCQRRSAAGSKRTWRAASTAPNTLPRYALSSRWPEASRPMT